ncbi:murein L,D-transpeptidase [Hartmannibacter diazotrophicus]|uniref:Murein L,D-transpeptidase n=1 Tax=Hartmannibacter diazotrophicus TaxID=1482074 RepID=A0A2C9D7M4_9HYPH|nr:L,D-transpeptidase family protein [Hartmannibacter diazotrophicus]SON56138.1 murein L,D-transpeptidase [Hartmannibacter diazotrophicus]
MKDLLGRTASDWASRGISRRSLLAGIGGAVGYAATPAFAQQFALSQPEWSDGFDTSIPQQAQVRTDKPTIGPETPSYVEAAIQRYADIVARGGWPYVNVSQALKVGVSSPDVAVLRQRLEVSGDLEPVGGNPTAFDSFVDQGLRRFQMRHGVRPDGVLGASGETIQAMNIPAEVRLRQLETNLVRVRSMSGFLGDRYVMVNVPAADIETIENGLVHSHHKAVVGKIDRPTPLLSTHITNIKFHPYWTVPISIIKKDVIPMVQKDPQYLSKFKIRIFDWKTHEEIDPLSIDWNTDQASQYMLRQDPSEINSLGAVKINFPSPEGVYMHDTPSKTLFGNDYRFDSSGCVRVQNVREYVTWILKYTPGWEDPAAVDAALRQSEQIDAQVADKVNLYFNYFTAWANSDGVVQFREDIYKKDDLDVALR